jgi:pSer/pThr/pTyr-binding forkhead associated (FHA) protein
VSWKLVSGEEQHTLESPGTVKVGRDRDNDIHVNREKISRVHAEIRINPESVQLVDLNSTNGTYVNDVRLSPNEPVSLQDGDIIRLGDTVFKFERMSQSIRKSE